MLGVIKLVVKVSLKWPLVTGLIATRPSPLGSIGLGAG